jgi:hypothetical protein
MPAMMEPGLGGFIYKSLEQRYATLDSDIFPLVAMTFIYTSSYEPLVAGTEGRS